MRKFFPLILVLVVVLVSVFAFAEDAIETENFEPEHKPSYVVPIGDYNRHVGDDGITVWFGTSNNFVVLPYMNRSGYYLDTNKPDLPQKATVTVRTEAYIPCYLTMTVMGNQAKTILESFGPNAFAKRGPEDNYLLAFDNEIGGFVNAAWQNLGHGTNAEFAPGKGYYIQGCDVFKVDIYANDTFKYDVIGKAFINENADISGPADETLNLEMRSKIGSNNWQTDTVVFTDTVLGNRVNILEKPACSSATVYHQFRVPYLTTTAHGKYTGAVIFEAYTI